MSQQPPGDVPTWLL